MTALLALLIAVGWPATVAPPTAAAAEPIAHVAVTLSEITPALPKRSNDVVLAGTVRNTSDVSLSNLQVIPWRSFDPLQTAEAVEQALDSPADRPLGYRVFRIFQKVPSARNPVLAPGESAPFRLTVPMSSFAFPTVDAIYLVGVHVRGRLTPLGADRTLGRSRTLLPVADGAARDPGSVRLTPLVVLSSRPSRLAPGVFTDTHLAGEVAENGRLHRLLASAAEPGRSFAVDPAVIDELRDMRSGYQVRTDDDTTRRGPGQADAAAWLEDFDRLLDDGDGYRLLYGSPDVAALVHDRQRGVLRDSAEAARAVTGLADLPLLALPATGRSDAPSAEAMAELNPTAIVLRRSTTQSAEALLAGPNGVPVVNETVSLSAAGPGPDPAAGPDQVRQRVLAEAWLRASTAGPDGSGIALVALVDSTAEAGVLHGALDGAPWLVARPLSDVLNSVPVAWSQQYRYPRSVRGRELGPAQLAAVRQLRSSQITFQQLLVNPTDYHGDAQAATATAASRYWRNRERRQRAFLAPRQRAVEAMVAGVSVVVTPKVVTSARRGLFPVTVRNQLPARADDPDYNAIQARLVFTSANGQRLSVSPVEAMNVRAQESFTTSAAVEARSNGTVRVVAQLYTTDGRAVGNSVPIDVNATQAGTIGWLIAIGAGAVLIGTTTWRIRQVARERSQGEATAGPRPLDVSRPVEQIDA